MKEYEFWREQSDGRIYAVELEDGVVVGSCGPLTSSEIDDGFLRTFDYSAERLDWLDEHRQDFDLYRQISPHALDLDHAARPELARRRVSEAMHPGMITCMPRTPLRDVARMMARANIHAVIVWGDEEDDSEGVWGVISDLDLVTAAGRGGGLAHSALGAANTAAVTIRAGETLQRAAELMHERRVTHLIVLADERDRPLGVLSTLDLARAIASVG